MATRKELEHFLKAIEKRALRQTMFAVSNRDIAQDLIQDAMMKLARKYADKPSKEFTALFIRILQNTIRDYYRRNQIRRLWSIPFSSVLSSETEIEDNDIIDYLNNTYRPDKLPEQPGEHLQRKETLAIIETGIKSLPTRQRQALLLRYFEQMSVSETAQVMSCSEGSVKTHCARGLKTLSSRFESMRVEL